VVTDNNLMDLYSRTTFSVKDLLDNLVNFTAVTAENHPILKKKRFSIITAFNPMNESTSERDNQRNHKRLKGDLSKLEYVHYETVGTLDGHSELSFTIEEIPYEEAMKIGAKYRQYAILFNDEKGIRFIRCC